MSWEFSHDHEEETEHKTAIGDKVQLVSGGPDMTVTAIQEAAGGGKIITCTWFSGEPAEATNENLHSINLPDAAIIWLENDD